jgi:hypothetical protein
MNILLSTYVEEIKRWLSEREVKNLQKKVIVKQTKRK